MIQRPEWLPPMINVNGDFNTVIRRLYDIYERDFKHGAVMFGRNPVICNQRVLPGEQYEEGFWHLVTRTDQKTKDRLFDPRRAERLPWCGAILSNANESEIKLWVYREGKGRLRTYAWLEQLDYVVIVEQRPTARGNTAFLITAYHVDGPSVRRSLQRKYDQREP